MIESTNWETYILWVFKFLTYFVAIYLHIKVIHVSIREKGLTWKLDITNSSISIAHFTHVLFLYGITYFVEDLSLYTGDWYCYLAKEVRFYGALYVMGHSLIVSIMKYVLIVYWENVRGKSKETIKQIFFWLDLLHPIITIGAFIIIVPDFIWDWDGYKEIDLCLGDPKQHWVQNSNSSQTKGHTLCIKLLNNISNSYLDYTVSIIRSSLCWIQVAAWYLIGCNFFEMILYCRIFSSMRRQITNPPNKRKNPNGEELQLDEADKTQLATNLKRMQVNAQITATLTMLEFLGYLTYVLQLKIAKGTNLVILIHFEAIYAILIPYAWLKNTSDNKNRIIEEGWKNIFKNILGLKNNSVMKPSVDKDLNLPKKRSNRDGVSLKNLTPSDINKAKSSSNVNNDPITNISKVVGDTISPISSYDGRIHKKLLKNNWFEPSYQQTRKKEGRVPTQMKTKHRYNERLNARRGGNNAVEILHVEELHNQYD